MAQYTTGEIAKLCGITVRTVQYYDARGILTPSALSEGGRRLYSQADLEKMKVVCLLRELDIPIRSVQELLQEKNSREVITLLLSQQEKALSQEIAEKQRKKDKLIRLRQGIECAQDFSFQTIGDIAHRMENKKKLDQIHWTMVLTGIPFTIMEWTAILLWILHGNWWLFAAYLPLAVAYGALVSRYYFRRVSYICPQCHKIFRPGFWEAFFARHTPSLRKLHCPDCGYYGFCVETVAEKEDS